MTRTSGCGEPSAGDHGPIWPENQVVITHLTPARPSSLGPSSHGRGPNPGRGGWVLGLVALISLVLVVVVGATVLRETPSTASISKAAETPQPASTSEGRPTDISTAEQRPPEQLSPMVEETGRVETDPPETAVPCPMVHGLATSTLQRSARGNDATTCPFAENVRLAYHMSGSAVEPVMISAHSPVTGLDYDMYCTGDVPVTCQGGTNALVFLY